MTSFEYCGAGRLSRPNSLSWRESQSTGAKLGLGTYRARLRVCRRNGIIDVDEDSGLVTSIDSGNGDQGTWISTTCASWLARGSHRQKVIIPPPVTCI